jgi:Cu2+-exporting ATPase
VFDQTGTLTEDRLELAATVARSDHPVQADRATALAAQSLHPLSQALVKQGPPPATVAWQGALETPGEGLEATFGDTRYRLGSAAWCGAAVGAVARPAVWWSRAVDGRWQPLARFEFDEVLRPDAIDAVHALQARGLRVHLLSGDQAPAVQTVARTLGLVEAQARCTPQAKLAAVAALQAQGRRVAMVGDGINDAPVLAAAQVSVAMGSAAALAQARADFIVMGNRLSDLPFMVDHARRTLRIVRQNLGWAVAYNLASVPLAMVGWMPPWLAGIGMAGSSLLVVLNALRLTR